MLIIITMFVYMKHYKETIKKLGVTKKSIAERIGITNVLFSYYLNETRPIPEHIEKKLKEELNYLQKVLS